MLAVAVFILLVYIYSLLSKRLEETFFTIPLFFTLAGMALALISPGLVRREVGGDVWLILAEITYAIVIFNGATKVDLSAVRRQMQLPGRLLVIGLPLTILCGMLASLIILPELSLSEAGLLACMLSTTDTSLANMVVSSKRVPGGIREALNLESGLSDGLIVPFVMVFIGLIKTEQTGLGSIFLLNTGQQIGFGIPVGAAIGFAGGWLLNLARRRGWATEQFQQIAMIALVPLILIIAKFANTSPFIAALAAGICVKLSFREATEGIGEFSENEGRLLQMFAFFLFSTVIGLELFELHPASILYAIISLTVVRMLPVAISMIGTRLSAASVLFMGWFGPRGLASIVLGLVIAGQAIQTSGTSLIREGLMVTVLLSVIAHGLTASPGIRIYAQRIACLNAEAPEHTIFPELPPI